ncbi:unnamed protein product [Ixodes persulcatus]
MSEQNGRIVPSCAAQWHHVSTFTFRHSHYKSPSPATRANVPRFSLLSTEKPPADHGDFAIAQTNILTAGVGRIVCSHRPRKLECTIRLFAEPSPTSTLECGRDSKENPRQSTGLLLATVEGQRYHAGHAAKLFLSCAVIRAHQH